MRPGVVASTILVSCVHLFVSATVAPDAAAVSRKRPARPVACPPALLSEFQGVTDLIADGTHVYFGDVEGAVRRVPKAGGPSEVLVHDPALYVLFLAADATEVYFVGRKRTGSPADDIYAVSKHGGAARTVITGLTFPRKIVADGEWLYVLVTGTQSAPGAWNANGGLLRVRKDGSLVETLASGLRLPWDMRLEGEHVYFIESGITGNDPNAGIRRVQRHGGEVALLLNASRLWSLALDETNMYVFVRGTSSPQGEVVSVARSTGETKVLATGVGYVEIHPLEVSQDAVYYLNILSQARAALESVRVSDGQRSVLTELDWEFPALAVDGCSVYFGTTDGVQRVPR